jgi:hypothetical protein
MPSLHFAINIDLATGKNISTGSYQCCAYLRRIRITSGIDNVVDFEAVEMAQQGERVCTHVVEREPITYVQCLR